jgi:putative sterol carrier protein
MFFWDLLLTIGACALLAAILIGVPALLYLNTRKERRAIDKTYKAGRPPMRRGRPVVTSGITAVMSLQEVTAMLKEGASSRPAFGNTVKFRTGQGVIFIDGNQTPPSVSNDDKAADCTLKMDLGDVVALITGELDGMSAFMTGRLKIEGDISVALRLRNILQ